MKSTIATRFRCSSPLTDFEQSSSMFDAFILQYLHKLVERKVGDFASPQAFHSVKVQGFNRNRIKLLTKFRSKLPLKIFALIADFPIQACDLSHTPPPSGDAGYVCQCDSIHYTTILLYSSSFFTLHAVV